MAKERKFFVSLMAPEDVKDLAAWLYSLCGKYESAEARYECSKDGRNFYRVDHDGEKVVTPIQK